jgi:DNA helicase-2/ATP-dependent DNA helicase PcrA
MAATTTVTLTDQQQAIVNHNLGPALVFAVAGAGKTTAMVHRIARLVRERVFPAEQILATSFNKAANTEIEGRLKQHPGCGRVQIKTLHALGFFVVREAHRRGYLPHIRPESIREGVDNLDRQLLYKTLAEARKRRVRYADELNRLDHDDFLNYAGACKGNLHYADLDAAKLPAEARGIAKQARPPAGLTWYLDLYRIYEQLRRQEGWLTFDDMLMTGWEVLVRHEEILAQFRRQYQCVLVDEFQDINLAQAEILDRLTWPQRHYMAIGDDDQTIYEWRGASPRFILDFEARYGAQIYLMTDNFRCPAAQVALANRVIEHNRTRRPKQMRLTKGFAGEAHLHHARNPEQMARHIAGEIGASLRSGASPADSAILVRIYAQTPPIEQQLIAAHIPYQVVGSEPFYERPEVRVLLNYCHVALVEQNWQAKPRGGDPLGAALDTTQEKAFRSAWFSIYNQPTRYLARTLAEKVAGFVTGGQLSVSRALAAATNEAPERTALALGRLADDIKWLAQALATKTPADKILQQLEGRLRYMDYLKTSSSFPETGATKAAGVATFLDYARGKGTIPQFLHHLEELAAAHAKASADPSQPQVTITTMFRAKGLEWPLVFIPNCNNGTIPYERKTSLEEERRLLYVAITRTRRTLHLYTLAGQPPSPFLEEADAVETLTSVAAIQRALSTEPKAWRTEEMVALAVLSQRLCLADYFRTWWDAPPAQRQRLARLALRILDSIDRHGLRQTIGVQHGDEILWQELATQ